MMCPECGRVWSGADSSPCPACAELAERRRGLQPAMRALAARTAQVLPPEELEAAVMAAFDRTARRGRGVTRRWIAVAGGALAASLMAGVLLVRSKPVAPAPVNESATQTFIPFPFTAPLQPYERVLVVQRDVPVSELIAAGFRVQNADPGGSVRADVMVSQDGRLRAIRPVSFNVSDGGFGR